MTKKRKPSKSIPWTKRVIPGDVVSEKRKQAAKARTKEEVAAEKGRKLRD